LSKKLIVVIICLFIALLSLNHENKSLGDAESMLISKMLENERIAEVFSMSDEGVST
jgi:hypothetical protein